MKGNYKLLFLSILMFCSIFTYGQVYVNHAATGANNGSSWANAYTDLKQAIDNTTSGEIWVAQGTYYPTSGTDRTISFTLKNNVQIYGGFVGTESNRSQRDYENNETIMSGDIGASGDRSDNSYSVISSSVSASSSLSTIIDGLTIEYGNSDGTFGNSKQTGGGLYLAYTYDVTIKNCIFRFNRAVENGGAIAVGDDSELSLTNVTFQSNSCGDSGGAISLDIDATLTATNCLFERNQAYYSGGAVSTTQSGATYSDFSSTFTNCIFYNNRAPFQGGALHLENGTTDITGCTFMYNYATESFSTGGAIDNATNKTTIINSVFYNNAAGENGGAIYNWSSNPMVSLDIFQGTFYKNSIRFGLGAGVYDNSTISTEIRNSIFYDNEKINTKNNSDYHNQLGGNFNIEYTNIQGLTCTGCTSTDPLFDTNILPKNIILSLKADSPLIDAGDNASIPSGTTTDILDNNRVNGTVDMGAYEYSLCNAIAVRNRIYVDSSNTVVTDNGISWAAAFQDLQAALTFAATCDHVQEIWVAGGTYYPTSGTDRTISFALKDGIRIYGGFAGDETELSERNIENNPTILSGDIRILGDNSDNSHHVVQSIGNNNTAILDGFMIENGNANTNVSGASTLTTVGGGFYGDASSAILQNCTFRNNIAFGGGGIYNINPSTPQFINCVMHDNSSVTTSGFEIGAGAYVEDCSPDFVNCLFYNNTAPFGGGLGVYSGTTTIINSTFTENSASLGGAIFINTGTVNITNTISWNNSASTGKELYGTGYNVTHSIIEGGYAGTGNLNQNPNFADAANDDFSLTLGSPAIDNGNNNASNINIDIIGADRITGGTIDMGAYEYPLNLLYVNHAATGANDGSSWANAYTDLQDAIDAANANETIWVAAGTYLPTKDHTGNSSPTNNRNKNFHLSTDMKIYGGFNGTETSLSQRDWTTNITILSGDFNNDDIVTGSGSSLAFSNITENAYHIFITTNLTTASLIDGFTIKSGNANSIANITYQGKIFFHDDGGGIYNLSSSPTIANITFMNNNVYDVGGGMFNDDASPTIINTIFTNNNANDDGGGMFNNDASPTITNTIFTNNNANDDGGGIFNFRASPVITNVTFANNNADDDGGGIFNLSISSPIITNTIFWNNTVNGNNNVLGAGIRNGSVTSQSIVSYSLTQDSTFNSEIGIIYNQNPNFVDAANGDFRLNFNSPAINAGDDVAISVDITTDIIGNHRISDAAVDMGAYENNFCAYFTNNRLYVDAANAATTQNGLSWATAFSDLQMALARSANFECVQEIWVADGTYFPTSGTDRFISFELQDNLTIYGGFAGNETELSQRDIQNNLTILSGDIGITGNNSDNSYHVIESNSHYSTAILDGFIIKNGKASGSIGYFYGGGYYGTSSDAVIKNCTFENNESLSGSAVFQQYGNPQFINCIFKNNTAVNFGGAMFLSYCNTEIINCLFYDNYGQQGGGLYSTGVSDIVNCTFTENSAKTGGAIYAIVNDQNISNSIFWNNIATIADNEIHGTNDVTYSIVEGGYTGTGNLNSDPLFTDAANNDFGFSFNSPAFNAGTNSTVPFGITDLVGNNRILGNTVDLGAYEYNYCDEFANSRIYVDLSNTSSTKNGSSWATAFQDLQKALAIASFSCVQEVWVANGTYYTTSGTDQNISFELVNDVAIYGGFAGTEMNLSERDIENNPTILSGDIGISNNNNDNAYHVVKSENTINTAILDGFTIQYGNADLTASSNENGGGILGLNSKAIIQNCIIENNNATRGGGLYMTNGSASKINNCIFRSNIAVSGGGAAAAQNSTAFTNCLFYNNLASSNGGGIYNLNSNTPITNCTFSKNIAASTGGSIYSLGVHPTVKNSILWDNTASSSSEIYSTSSMSVTYSIIEGGYTGTGNLNSDPLFTDAANDNYSLSFGSPALNTGDNSAVPSGITTDIIGKNRIAETTVDMGAYENNFCNEITNNRIYVDANNSSGTENGLSWATAFQNLQTALELTGFSCIQEVWVANGTYYPTSGTDRTISFQLKNGVAIYGGFAGNETELLQRNLANNTTILSGDIGILANNSDNAFHVVQGASNNNTAILDGFIIEYGNANVNSTGKNFGGGYYGDASNAILKNCIFRNNQARGGGGLAQVSSSSPQFINCIFHNNIATGSAFAAGGGGYVYDAAPSFINCLFYDNSSGFGAGLSTGFSPNTNVINCTFTENTVIGGGAVYQGNGGIFINSIFWNNSANEISSSTATVTYSIIEGGYAGTGNLNQNPNFVDAANNNFALQSASPGIDAGNNAAIPAGITTDLAGYDRIINGTVNIGAYETSSSVLPVELLYFKGETVENGNLLTWETTTEINNEGFEIQRSEDGRNWFKIGFVQGAGTTLENQFYSFIDENPINGVNYYRLKQLDFDGNFDYSNIVNIQTIRHSNNQTLVLYPNPVRNDLTIENGEGNVIIYNNLGQPVRQLAVDSQQFAIDLSDLPQGIYTLKLQKTNGTLISKQFVKL